ncbi:hypothetical protein PC129_g24953, partial [Phytophthora cactorum]
MGIESANVLTELLAKADQAALVTMKMTNKNEQAVAAAHNNRVLAHTKRSLKRGCSGVGRYRSKLSSESAPATKTIKTAEEEWHQSPKDWAANLVAALTAALNVKTEEGWYDRTAHWGH